MFLPHPTFPPTQIPGYSPAHNLFKNSHKKTQEVTRTIRRSVTRDLSGRSPLPVSISSLLGLLAFPIEAYPSLSIRLLPPTGPDQIRGEARRVPVHFGRQTEPSSYCHDLQGARNRTQTNGVWGTVPAHYPITPRCAGIKRLELLLYILKNSYTKNTKPKDQTSITVIRTGDLLI